MGYVEDTTTGTLVHKRGRQDDNDEDDPAHAPSPPPLVGSAMPSSASTHPSNIFSTKDAYNALLAKLDSMETKIMDTYATMRFEIDNNTRRLGLLQDTIEEKFDAANDAMTSHFNDVNQHIQLMLQHQESMEAHIVQFLPKEGS